MGVWVAPVAVDTTGGPPLRPMGSREAAPAFGDRPRSAALAHRPCGGRRWRVPPGPASLRSLSAGGRQSATSAAGVPIRRGPEPRLSPSPGGVLSALSRLLYCAAVAAAVRRSRVGAAPESRCPRGGHLVSLRAQSERMTTCVNWSPSLARSASVATIIRTRTRRTIRTASRSRSTVAGAGRTLCTRRRARRSPLCP